MSLADRKITSTDITSKGVVAAPDTMTGTAQENKMVFDRLIREVVKEDMNGVIDDLMASTAAAEIGFDTPEDMTADNVQDAIEEIKDDTETGVAKAIAEALKSEGYAVGKQNGVDVESGSTYYHNNSKYYSDQASGSADTATAQAGIATTKAVNASASATAASGYANDALGYRNTAEAHKNDASDYKDAASASALSASGSATAAGNSETNASAKALVSEGYALGKQNGIDVEEGSEYYHNNAKYFKEQAGEASVGYVSYASAQSIPTSGKLQARTNIDAEDFGNKVTSVNSSSSDTQYPSAKLLYDTKVALESADSTLNLNKADREDVHSLINIWDEQWELGAYDSSTGEKTSSNSNIRCTNKIKVNASTSYYFKGAEGKTYRVLYYGSSGSLISTESLNMNAVFTTPSNTAYIAFHCGSTYGTTYNSDISINYPSTYTGYYPSALPREIAERKDEDFMITMDGFISPTINGIKNYWDGSLYHRRIARVDLGSLNWTYDSSYHNFTTTGVASTIKAPTYDSSIPNIVCLRWTPQSMSGFSEGGIAVHTLNKSVIVKTTSYSDALAFKQAMSGTFLYYELATEQTCNIDANGLRFELLWTNSSPAASFTAQTVSLDLSKYRMILVYFNYSTGSQYRITTIVPIGYSHNIVNFKPYYGSLYAYRDIEATSSSVIFTDAYSNTNVDNTVAIPYQIYGIR